MFPCLAKKLRSTQWGWFQMTPTQDVLNLPQKSAPLTCCVCVCLVGTTLSDLTQRCGVAPSPSAAFLNNSREVALETADFQGIACNMPFNWILRMLRRQKRHRKFFAPNRINGPMRNGSSGISRKWSLYWPE